MKFIDNVLKEFLFDVRKRNLKKQETKNKIMAWTYVQQWKSTAVDDDV